MDSKGEFDRVLGIRIRNARERAGVKQDQLARAVGLSRTSITNIERGRQGVQAYLLARVAAVLGMSVADLIPDEQPPVSTALPEKVNRLEPNQREWARRVLSSGKEDGHAA